MRQINLIIIHCSAVRPNQTSSAKEIEAWHKARGFKRIGYHYVVRRDGTVERGRELSQIGAHTKGHNAFSVGICYEGGLDGAGSPCDTRTPAQKATLLLLIHDIRQMFPNALVAGHNQFDAKACPCFDVRKDYKNAVQIPPLVSDICFHPYVVPTATEGKQV